MGKLSAAGTSDTARTTEDAPFSAATLSPHEASRLMKRFADCRVLIVGDVMMDEYLAGDAERISPEAPVPVVLISSDKRLLGGAGNVARNIRALGGQVSLIGVRGNDSAGIELGQCLEQDGIAASLLTLPDRPTTIKTRILARLQQVLRIDREDTSPLTDFATAEILSRVEQELSGCHAVIVSDYGKGLVSAAFMEGLQQLIARDGRNLPVLVDPKPQNIFAYCGMTLLTPNAKEASEAVNLPTKTPEQIITAGRAIMEKLQCPHLLITLGPLGMAVFQSPHEVWHIPTVAQHVFDVTGAGDTVIATTALALAAGATLAHACILANHAAGIVVAEVGAATATPAQIQEALTTLPPLRLALWS